MSWRTSPLVINLRSFTRNIGLTRVIGRALQRSRYEQAFDDALFGEIRSGDVIWDVGANVGYYTKKFAETAGPGGHICAFEPFPETVDRLRGEVAHLDTVSIHPIALGSDDGILQMQAGTDALGATNRIIEGEPGSVLTTVEVSTADSIYSNGIAKLPNVVKIDTEGYEHDVLSGMSCMLDKEDLRAVFIEVHFGILANRGMPHAPSKIETLLTAKGFNVFWVDPSHLAAYRG